MYKYFSFNKIYYLVFVSIFFFLITGPAIPDIFLTFLVLVTLFLKRDIFFSDNRKWFILYIILWVWFIISSLFAYNIYNSLIETVIFIRFILFIFISYLLLKNLEFKLLKYLLYFIFICCLFVTIDTLYQYYNYSYTNGFGEDLFGRKPEGLYGRLSGPFNDLVPGSYLSRLCFFILIIYLINFTKYSKKIELNFLFISSLGLIFSTIYLTGERMSVATTLLGLFLCILFASKLRKVLCLSFLFSIIFISLNINFHPHYKNYKILKSNSQHEGLIIEREIACNDNMLCSKEFKVQPEFLKILKEFNKSAYGEIYLSGLHMWTDFKLFGIGLNNFYTVCINEKKYNKYNTSFGCTTHPHNMYLQSLVETGLIGFLIFLFLMLLIIIKIVKTHEANLRILLFSIYLTIFWPIMSTGSFLKNWNMVFISLIISMILIFSNIKLEDNKIEKSKI